MRDRGDVASVLVAVVGILGCCYVANAQPGRVLNPAEAESITTDVMSGDSAKQDSAISKIREALKRHDPETIQFLRGRWIRALVAVGRNTEVVDFATVGIDCSPQYAQTVEQLLQARIKARVALKSFDLALMDCKSLYSVSTMDGTAVAIDLISDVLVAKNGGDRSCAEKFRAEQLAGADFKAGTPIDVPVAVDPNAELQKIHVEPTEFELVLSKLPSDPDYSRLCARGNLLLLEGRPADALKEFEQASPLATGGQIPWSIENIARAMKASDLSIGRANAYIIANGESR